MVSEPPELLRFMRVIREVPRECHSYNFKNACGNPALRRQKCQTRLDLWPPLRPFRSYFFMLFCCFTRCSQHDFYLRLPIFLRDFIGGGKGTKVQMGVWTHLVLVQLFSREDSALREEIQFGQRTGVVAHGRSEAEKNLWENRV